MSFPKYENDKGKTKRSDYDGFKNSSVCVWERKRIGVDAQGNVDHRQEKSVLTVWWSSVKLVWFVLGVAGR